MKSTSTPDTVRKTETLVLLSWAFAEAKTICKKDVQINFLFDQAKQKNYQGIHLVRPRRKSNIVGAEQVVFLISKVDFQIRLQTLNKC